MVAGISIVSLIFGDSSLSGKISAHFLAFSKFPAVISRVALDKLDFSATTSQIAFHCGTWEVLLRPLSGST